MFGQEDLNLSAKAGIEIIGTIDKWVDEIGKEAYKRIKGTGTLKRFRKLPGIDRILGVSIMLETGDPGRFKDEKKYLSYCRLVESRRTSNGRKKGSGTVNAAIRY